MEITVTHRLLAHAVTLKVDRDLVTRALSGYNDRAERALAMQIRQAYNSHHNKNIHFLPWMGMTIKETEVSEQTPHGCSCSCAGCDDQGWHCHKTDRGCFM